VNEDTDMSDITVNSGTQGVYMGNESSETRNAYLKLLAQRAGFRLPETRVPEGESLLPIGEENKRKLETEVAALPDLSEGLAALRQRVKEENPVDVKVPISQVRMSSERAGLFGKGQDPGKALGYTEAGFSHVVGMVKPDAVRQGASSVLLSLSPKTRADVFNEWAERKVLRDDAVLRTILHPESKRRVIRAVTSTKHSQERGDDLAIASVLERSLPKGGKLRITRNFDRTDFEILFPMLAREVRVGDAVMAKVHVTNSETKAHSWEVFGGILRVLCFNFITAWAGKDEAVGGKHVGDIGPRIADAVLRALRTIEPFVHAFGDAYSNELPGTFPTRGEVLTRVGSALALPDSTLTLAGQLWDADGVKGAGNTLAGLVNALTRASQEETMAQAAVTEQVAGRLVMEGWAALN
jgi:hypothetical protein